VVSAKSAVYFRSTKDALLNRLLYLLFVLGILWTVRPLAAQQPPGPADFAQPAAAPVGVAPEQPAKKSPLTFFQIVFSGGPLGIANMVVLIGLSLTAAFLVFDNLLVIRKRELIPDGLSDEVRRLLAENQQAAAVAACKEKPCFLSFVLLHGLSEADGGWSEIEKAMEDATAEQAARLFRRIEYLSVIGNIAPMVGLLGTVTGMLLAFKQVADTEGNAGAAQLADGIYQALVTTVVGLIIAIPALGAFALFRSWVDQFVAEAAYAALHGLSPLKQRRSEVAPPVQPPPPPPRRG
jgi:biopolymer transport protein ExbB